MRDIAYIAGEGVCIHKTTGAYESVVGWVCPTCQCIRHRHSHLELVEVANFGGMSIQTTVPRRI